VTEIVKDPHLASGPQTSDAAWDRWLEHVLTKTLYMLWIASRVGGAPCDPEYWVDSKEMVGFLLQPRWREFGLPDLEGLKGVRAPLQKPPVLQIRETCRKLAERVKRNRELMGCELSGDEMEPLDGSNLSDEFYDDSDLDDLSELGEDEEYFIEEYEDEC
jgi:hypothetical protein